MSLHSSIRRIVLTACVVAMGSAHADTNSILDKEITRQVKQVIAEHPDLGLLLTVQTRNGVVYLGGSTSTIFAQDNAESVAQQVPGVKTVIDISGVSE